MIFFACVVILHNTILILLKTYSMLLKGRIMKKISKEELELMYRNNTNEHCCSVLGVSKATFIRYLSDAGISLKGKGSRKKYQIGN